MADFPRSRRSFRSQSFLAVLAAAALACGLPERLARSNADPGVVKTSVAGTLTAAAGLHPAATPQILSQPQASPTGNPTPEPIPTPVPPPSATPPPNGISLNCDDTYQRVRIVDEGASGKTVAVDKWNGVQWLNVWSLASGDPMLRQLTDEAGYYQFGECRKLVLVPFQHSNPQLWFELGVFAWNGTGMLQVYFNEGYYGEWERVGDLIRFREASLLGWVNGGPLGACEWLTLEHTWNGTGFTQSGSLVEPVANCTPAPTAAP